MPNLFHFRFDYIDKGKAYMRFNEKSTDIELIQACIENDRMAQHIIFRRYYGKVMGICMRYMGDRDEASEVLNAVFLKIYRSANQYVATGPLGGWIGKIALHTAIDFIRQRTSFRKHYSDNEIPEIPVQNEAINLLTEEALFAMIQELPSSNRAVFSLFVIEGYSHDEISKTLGISNGTSKWHLNQARGILQEKLKKNTYKSLLYDYV